MAPDELEKLRSEVTRLTALVAERNKRVRWLEGVAIRLMRSVGQSLLLLADRIEQTSPFREGEDHGTVVP